MAEGNVYSGSVIAQPSVAKEAKNGKSRRSPRVTQSGRRPVNLNLLASWLGPAAEASGPVC